MYICICNGLKYEDIKKEIDEKNLKNIEELKSHINVANCCTMCECEIEEIINENKK